MRTSWLMYEEDGEAIFGFIYPLKGSRINHENITLSTKVKNISKFRKKAKEWELSDLSTKKEIIKFFKDASLLIL